MKKKFLSQRNQRKSVNKIEKSNIFDLCNVILKVKDITKYGWKIQEVNTSAFNLLSFSNFCTPFGTKLIPVQSRSRADHFLNLYKFAAHVFSYYPEA